jgi:hypothetical protein
LNNLILLLLVSISTFVVAIGVILILLSMLLSAFDLGMRIWVWKNGTSADARTTDFKKVHGGRSTHYYAWYEFSVGEQVYMRNHVEIASSYFQGLASGEEKLIPIRYAATDPTISYPWSQAGSHGSSILGILFVAVLCFPLLLISPRNASETIAVICILGIVVAWVGGLFYAYNRPYKVFSILMLIEQERPSKDLFRRIFNIALNKSE